MYKARTYKHSSCQSQTNPLNNECRPAYEYDKLRTRLEPSSFDVN